MALVESCPVRAGVPCSQNQLALEAHPESSLGRILPTTHHPALQLRERSRLKASIANTLAKPGAIHNS